MVAGFIGLGPHRTCPTRSTVAQGTGYFLLNVVVTLVALASFRRAQAIFIGTRTANSGGSNNSFPRVAWLSTVMCVHTGVCKCVARVEDVTCYMARTARVKVKMKKREKNKKKYHMGGA